MKQEERSSILWLGEDIPPRLTAEFQQRGEIRIIPTSRKNLAELAPAARGVIIEFDGDPSAFETSVQQARDVCLDHGLRVGLVRSQTSDENLFASLVEKPEHSVEELNRVRWYLGNDWANVAEWMAHENAGPGANPLLRIKCEKDTTLDNDEQLLLMRAFYKFDAITVKRISGGYSGAKTYRVSAARTGPGCVQRLTPYLAKIGDIASIYREIDNYNQYAAEYIPFNHRPNLNPELIAYGQRSAIMVEDFLHEATQLSESWGNGGVGPIVQSLFENALQGWRFQPRQRESVLASQFKALKVLRFDRDLKDNGAARAEAVLASKSYGATLNPDELVHRIEALPAVRWCECIVHGDFHAQNVFVKTGSPETYIIDYSNAASGPAVADPASLEVSLTFRFPPPDRFDPDYVLKLYKYPLLIPGDDLRLHHGDCHFMWEIVRAIRRQLSDADRFAYIIAVICCLLQAASYDNIELKRRAVAYYVAERLTRELEVGISEKKN